jgi:hypothetical protein
MTEALNGNSISREQAEAMHKQQVEQWDAKSIAHLSDAGQKAVLAKK